MKKDNLIFWLCTITVVLFFSSIFIWQYRSLLHADDEMAAKPVIYLYPEEETEVSVKLDYDGELTCVYPAYEDGWRVTAAPDGTLTDADGQTYNYLYWEGLRKNDYDLSRGFCVAGEDTAAFLDSALADLGLTRREANEFIVYWLPLMEENPYNLIAFQEDAHTESAVLTVDPAPDTTIRVFIAWKGLDKPIEIPPQELTAPSLLWNGAARNWNKGRGCL